MLNENTSCVKTNQINVCGLTAFGACVCLCMPWCVKGGRHGHRRAASILHGQSCPPVRSRPRRWGLRGVWRDVGTGTDSPGLSHTYMYTQKQYSAQFLFYPSLGCIMSFSELNYTTLQIVPGFHQPNSNVHPLAEHQLLQSGTKTWLLVVHIHAVPCLHAGLNYCVPLVILIPSCDRITPL